MQIFYCCYCLCDSYQNENSTIFSKSLRVYQELLNEGDHTVVFGNFSSLLYSLLLLLFCTKQSEVAEFGIIRLYLNMTHC